MINIEISYLIAISTGILSSVHCLGMCGGITIFLSLNSKNNKKFYYYICNFGRIFSYSFIGALSSFFGILITKNNYSDFLIIFRIISEVSIISIGIYIIFGFNFLIHLEKIGFSLFSNINNYSFFLFPIEKFWKAFLVGLVWGFIPCGIVYNVLIWTLSSGSVFKSAVLMFLFGLGTLPAIILTGKTALFYKKIINNFIIKTISGLSLILLGIIGIYITFFLKCH